MVWGPDRSDSRKMGCHPIEKLVLGNGEYLLFCQRRKDIFESFGDHTLPASGAPLHKEIMHPRCSDKRGAFGDTLSFHITEVTLILFFIVVGYLVQNKLFTLIVKALCIGFKCAFIKDPDRFIQRLYRDELHTGDMRKITDRLFGYDRPLDDSLFFERKDQRKEHGTCFHPAVQAEFTEYIKPLFINIGFVQCDQQCNGKVDMRAFFGDIRRTEVYRHFQRWKGKTVCKKCRLAAFCKKSKITVQ